VASSGLALRIVTGPRQGTVVSIAEGSSIVGRSPDCAIVVADPSLSRRHFELRAQDDTCWLIDLESRNGVLVNGAGVLRKRVRAGDEICAGDVVFRIEIERLTPREMYPDTAPMLEATAPAPPAGSLPAVLRAGLPHQPSSKLYALVDGAKAFELAFAARLMGHAVYTLFSGQLAPVTAHVGPLLVAVGEPSAFLKRWTDGIGGNAGVLFESTADLESLYAHLRGIFVVDDDEGNEYFFRFYDPRVIRVFLPTCTAGELAEFFGPVTRWIVEGEGGAPGYAVYTLAGQQLNRTDIAAAVAPAG